jgi:four helix bundle protein
MAGRGFEELDCYQLALEVFREAYAVAQRLPKHELYNLSSQLRRAATSTTLNIAEGYGRFHFLDKARFYYIARGSLSETLAAFIDCHVAGYITDERLADSRDLCGRSLQALNGLIRYTNRQRQGQREYGDRAVREPSIEYGATLADRIEGADAQESEPPLPEFPNLGSSNHGSSNHESTNHGG